MIAALLLLGCGAPEDSAGGETGACAEAPVLMYANFGEGFLRENCQSCHAAASLDRNGAPEGVVFDTLADVVAQADAIRAAATGAEPSMPPQGGVDEQDREKLAIWLDCWLDEEVP